MSNQANVTTVDTTPSASRRAIRFVVNFPEFQQMLEGRLIWRLPEGSRIVAVRESYECNGMMIYLHNDAFPEVPPYCVVPLAHDSVYRATDETGRFIVEVKP